MSDSSLDWLGISEDKPVAVQVGDGLELPVASPVLVADALYDQARLSFAINQCPDEVLNAVLDVQDAAHELHQRVKLLGAVVSSALKDKVHQAPGTEHSDVGDRPIERKHPAPRPKLQDRDDCTCGAGAGPDVVHSGDCGAAP